jgi:hypothetical protein
MIAHLRRHFLSWLLLVVAVGLLVGLRPRNFGLRVTRFEGNQFDTPLGRSDLDQRVHFASGTSTEPPPRWLRTQMAARWEGFFEAPREGDYRFGLTSDDSGWLFIDGRRVINNGGVHPARTVETGDVWLTKGLHQIRIDYYQGDGGAVMQLDWRIPSGYFTLGRMPVAIMHPDQISLPGAREHALRLLPWLLVTVAAVLFGRRRIAAWWGAVQTDAVLRRHVTIGLCVCVATLGVRMVQLNGAGETCDEWAYVGAGRLNYENVAAGVFNAEQWKVNQEHPPVGKLIYGFVQYTFGDSQTYVRFAAALMNTATVLFAFLAALRIFGLSTAALTGALLAVLPSFVAHGKVSALDCPAGFFFTWAVWLFLRGLEVPEKRQRLFIWLTVITGLGIGTKFSNGLVAAFVLTAYPLLKWKEIRATGEIRLPWILLLFPALIFVPTFALWPWLWVEPGRHLGETFGHWKYVPHEIFFGTERALPVYSFALVFALVTPVILYLPFLVGVVQAFRRRPAPLTDTITAGDITSPRAWWLLIVGWFLLPFAWSFTGFRQDGIRYVYAAFPPFAIITAAGLVIFTRWIVRLIANASLARSVAIGLPALVIATVAFASARVHPYYLDYYNEIVGGATGAYQKRWLETAWWGEGVDSTVEWLNANAPKGAVVGYRGMVSHTFAGLRPDLKKNDHNPEYLATTDFKPGRETPPGYTEVFSVRVGKAPMAAVYKRNEPDIASPKP